jgi:flagellar hook-associated protein 3 FlgL
MAIDRVATSAQAQYMLAQVLKAEKSLNTYQTQVASGLVTSSYAELGDKAAALESAKAAAARAEAYAANTKLALTQTDLQDTQLTQLSNLAEQLKEAITSAAANADGTSLMDTAESIFEQAAAILNSMDSNGTYIYGGGRGDSAPFTATSLDELDGADVASFFANGSTKKTVLVGDGQTVEIGVLASDIGTGLMTALQNLLSADNSASLSGSLTSDQIANFSENVLPSVTTAYAGLNTATALNGETYSRLEDAIANQQALATLYQGFVSDIQDVDMPTAAANLSQAQTALEAALQVSVKLNNLSLLNYLPTTTG